MSHAKTASTRRARLSRLATAALVFTPLLLHLAPATSAALEFDRAAIAGGQAWRLITCHWTHWSGELLFWSWGVFALLVLLTRPGGTRPLAVIGVSTAVVGVAVLVGTDLPYYRGLSGVDSALFVMLALRMARESLGRGEAARPAAIALLLLAFVGKIVFECATGGAVFVGGGMVPVPLAHVAGAVVGMVLAMRSRDSHAGFGASGDDPDSFGRGRITAHLDTARKRAG